MSVPAAALSASTPNCLIEIASSADPRFSKLPKYQQHKWAELMLSTMFRTLSYAQLAATATRLFGKLDFKTIWRRTLQSGYVVRNVKSWIYFCAKRRLRGTAAESAAYRFQVEPVDWGLRLLVSTQLKSTLRKLSDKYPALSLAALDAQILRIFREMRDWLGKFVYRKMRFVYQQQGLEPHDMQMEVFAKGVQALYLMYPRVESELHATNIVKSAAHNYGINMLKQQTHVKRARITRASDGTFSSRVISLDELVTHVDLHAPDTKPYDDLRIDISRVYEQLATQGQWRQRKLIKLLMGMEDKGFNAWLITQQNIQSTCSEYIDRADPQRYLSLACQYLRLHPRKGRTFMTRLRDHFHAYAQP